MLLLVTEINVAYYFRIADCIVTSRYNIIWISESLRATVTKYHRNFILEAVELLLTVLKAKSLRSGFQNGQVRAFYPHMTEGTRELFSESISFIYEGFTLNTYSLPKGPSS